MRRAFFLDRDGVINKDTGYVHKKNSFVFLDGIFDLVSSANSEDFLVVVVTNQAGIARGMFAEEDFFLLTDWMCNQFLANHGRIDAVYFCPAHPHHGSPRYRVDSFYRKPLPGMLLRASRELNIDLGGSVLVGDSETDMAAGVAAGVGELIKVGGGECSLKGVRLVSTVRQLRSELGWSHCASQARSHSSTERAPIFCCI